jgi:hypothetical protein
MSKRLSALAQLLVLYRERGITRTSDLSKLIGFPEKDIARADAELNGRLPAPQHFRRKAVKP